MSVVQGNKCKNPLCVCILYIDASVEKFMFWTSLIFKCKSQIVSSGSVSDKLLPPLILHKMYESPQRGLTTNKHAHYSSSTGHWICQTKRGKKESSSGCLLLFHDRYCRPVGLGLNRELQWITETDTSICSTECWGSVEKMTRINLTWADKLQQVSAFQEMSFIPPLWCCWRGHCLLYTLCCHLFFKYICVSFVSVYFLNVPYHPLCSKQLR